MCKRRPGIYDTDLDGVADAIQYGLPARLAAAGIGSLGHGGFPSHTASDLQPTEQFRPHHPLRQLQAHLARHHALVVHTELLREASTADAIRIRSYGGDTAGTCLTARMQLGVRIPDMISGTYFSVGSVQPRTTASARTGMPPRTRSVERPRPMTTLPHARAALAAIFVATSLRRHVQSYSREVAASSVTRSTHIALARPLTPLRHPGARPGGAA